MAEPPHHIDLLRWATSLLSFPSSMTLGLIEMVQSVLKHTPVRDVGTQLSGPLAF